MKRIFSYVLSALLAVTFTTAQAQKKIFVWKDGGNVTIKSATDVDSLTFKVGKVVNIHTSDPVSVVANTIKASAVVTPANGITTLPKWTEVGVCISSTNAMPTLTDSHRYLGDSLATYDFTFYELNPSTTYYYRAYVKFGVDVFYGEVKSAKTGEATSSSDIMINGHKFADLGLPGGLLWAKCNVGAIASSDNGDYFAWGETSPKSYYYWNTYKWGKWGSISKYNSEDGKATLDLEDDAAYVNWGADCRMPSDAQIKLLIDSCQWTWQDDYQGAKGYSVTGPNGNSIFLPASGYRDYDFLDLYDRYEALGYYWERSNGNFSYVKKDGELHTWAKNPGNRFSGFPVRAVADKPSSSDIIINGHKFVDLGLPSGLLWAKNNIGAVLPSEEGDYFAWGETEPKAEYTSATYKWKGSSSSEMFKYNRTDGKKILDPEDDAATANWGTGCRMPSYADFMELTSECEWIQQENYQGVSGYLVKGPNGNSIFLPDAGHKPNGSSCSISYWSSSTASVMSQLTMAFGIGVRNYYTGNHFRYIGLPIRPVAEKTAK